MTSIASASSPLPLAPPLDGGRSAAGRAQGVGLAVLLCLAALQQQAGGGLLDAPSPINRQQAEGEIRSADVGTAAAAYRRGAFHAALVAWPSPDAGVARG